VAAIVSLRDVIDEMDMMSDEATAYINRKTGELITITNECSVWLMTPTKLKTRRNGRKSCYRRCAS